MAGKRWHGRFGRVYMALAAGGVAEPVAFMNAWEINRTTDKDDVTAFMDTNKVYVAGLPDANGSFAGFMDDGSAQTYDAASDGVARAFYLYPTSVDTSNYWYGTILPDYKANAKVDGPVEVAASWVAAGPVNRKP